MTNVILETIQPREFAARVVGYVLVLPLSLLMMLAVFRVIGGLKNAEHRSEVDHGGPVPLRTAGRRH